MLLWPREGAKKRAVIPCANAPGDQFPTPVRLEKRREAVNGPGSSSMVVHHRATANRTSAPPTPPRKLEPTPRPMHTSAPGVDAAYAQQTLGKDRGYESQKPAPVRLLLCTRMPFLACRVGSSAARQHCTRAQRGASQPLAACLYGCQPMPRPPGEMATPHPTTEIRLRIKVVLLRR